MASITMPKSATLVAVNAAREAAQTPRHSRRMGGSTIGDPCDRKLWYAFRWVMPPETHDARMLRLFETGHMEEARLLVDLSAAGLKIYNEQAEADLCGGHFVAKIDAMATGVIEAPKTAHIVECKSHNAKSFSALEKHGVEKAKPMHFAQVQIYMHATSLDRGLYVAVNKDTDAIYIERINLDTEAARRLEAKAARIIKSDNAPPRVSEDAEFFSCKWCRFRTLCHSDDGANRNCRTCLYSTPLMDGHEGAWACSKHDKTLTQQEQESGCAGHRYLPDLVPGEQIDVENGNVIYQMRDGSIWRDGDD